MLYYRPHLSGFFFCIMWLFVVKKVHCYWYAQTIISANVEVLSGLKEELLANICKDHHCDVLRLKQVHRGTTQKRPKIHGMIPQLNAHTQSMEVQFM